MSYWTFRSLDGLPAHTVNSHLFSLCFDLEEAAPQVSAVCLCLMFSWSVRLRKKSHDENRWECSSFRKLNFLSEIFKRNFSSLNVYFMYMYILPGPNPFFEYHASAFDVIHSPAYCFTFFCWSTGGSNAPRHGANRVKIGREKTG